MSFINSYMNFFKSIAALAVVTATSLTAIEPAKAQAGGTQLLEALQTAGVTFDTGECEAGVNGWFRPAIKHIRICDDAQNGWQTMRHEAVHAAQHCVHGYDMDTLYNKADINSTASSKLLSWISSVYPEGHYWVEAEAFILQNWTNHQIAGIVNKSCN